MFKMTRLAEWLFFGVLFLSFWLSLVTKKINHYILDEYSTAVLFLPIILIGLFGVYATVVVLWRVYTFNNCESAAIELKKNCWKVFVAFISFINYLGWSDFDCIISACKSKLKKQKLI